MFEMKPEDYNFLIGLLLAFLAFTLFICVYLIPTFIAYRKDKKDKLAILLINIFLGSTFIGWVIALVWALTSDKKSNND
jgi:cbb3-type cytochrome oxidase subunit 3